MLSKDPIFVNHFLERRLKRVPIEILKNFLCPLTDTEGLKTQRKLVEEIIAQYSIFNQNKGFIRDFNNFVRDYLLSARESEYLLKVKEKNQVIDWIRGWNENRFIGQNNYFSMHIHTRLEDKFLTVDDDEIPFPNEVILLVAFSKTPKQIPSGLELVEFYPTTEFEMIFRKDMDLIEVRGQNNIIKDFIYSAILDSDNPLAMSRSIFIGEKEDTQHNSIVKPARIISIEKLRAALDGTYTLYICFCSSSWNKNFEDES
jgi:hypothetical protein